MMIPRKLSDSLEYRLTIYPAVAILGPRQIGKTTLATTYGKEHNAVRIDLEDFSVLEAIQKDPKQYLLDLSDRLVILDEVQRYPNLFMMLRVIIDEYILEGRKYGHFILLGSASQELLKQSSESLTGRVSYIELPGLLPTEVLSDDPFSLSYKKTLAKLWLRGGFPESFTADSDDSSLLRRQDIIHSYMEKDIPQLTETLPAKVLHRLWAMLAHLQGEPLNTSKLGSSLEVSSKDISRHVDQLVDLMLLRKLESWAHGNIKKRLGKSPRLYFRDSGILHALLKISSFFALQNHPIHGKSWEGFVIESILNSISEPFVSPFFFRSTSGEEIDLLLEIDHTAHIAIDIKSGPIANVKKGFHQACRDINTQHKYVIYTGEHSYTLDKTTRVMPLAAFLEKFPEIIKASHTVSEN